MRTLYFCPALSSIFLFFFPRLFSAVADWMSTIVPHMVWPQCEFRMQKRAARGSVKYRKQKIAKNSLSAHHRTNLSGNIFATKACVDNRNWLYCVECPQYNTRLESLAYLYVSSNTMSPALRPTCVPSGILIHAAIWPQWTPAENCCASYGGAGFPCNTMWAGPTRTAIPNGILIRPAVDMGQKVGAAVPWLPVLIWTVTNRTVIPNVPY